MLKARLLLGALMIALVAGAFQIFDHPTMRDGDKNWLYLLDGLLFLSACILMTVNLFSLDENGRIPYDSVPHRLLSYWTDGKVPKELRLCPMFWMIFAMLTGTLVAVVMGSVFGYLVLAIIGVGIKTLFTNPAVLFTGVGWATLFIASVASVWFITSQFLKLLGAKQSEVWAILLLILSGMLFLVGSIMAKEGITLTAMAIGAVKFMGIAVGAVAILGVLIAIGTGAQYLLSWIFPKLRDSFLGQLAAAMVGKLCPVIEVETEPKPEENYRYDPLLFV